MPFFGGKTPPLLIMWQFRAGKFQIQKTLQIMEKFQKQYSYKTKHLRRQIQIFFSI